jgi:chromosome segregation ATPase
MPTIGQCEREIKKLKKHVVELNKLKQSRHELTSMFKEASALFGEYTESICNAIGEAVQKLDKQITLLEDPLFVVGESLESLPNRIVKEKQKHKNDNTKILAQEPQKPEFSGKMLALIKERYENNPESDCVRIFGNKSMVFGHRECFSLIPDLYYIPDLLKEHGL